MTWRDLGALAAPGHATTIRLSLDGVHPGRPLAGEIAGPGLDPDDPPTPGSDRPLSVVGSPIAPPSVLPPGRPGAGKINVNARSRRAGFLGSRCTRP